MRKELPARREGNQDKEVAEMPSKRVSRRERRTVSSAAKRSNKIRPEKCPLDLVTNWSLGTLARAAGGRGGGEQEEWGAGGVQHRPVRVGEEEGHEKEGTAGMQRAKVCGRRGRQWLEKDAEHRDWALVFLF